MGLGKNSANRCWTTAYRTRKLRKHCTNASWRKRSQRMRLLLSTTSLPKCLSKSSADSCSLLVTARNSLLSYRRGRMTSRFLCNLNLLQLWFNSRPKQKRFHSTLLLVNRLQKGFKPSDGSPKYLLSRAYLR